MIPGPRGATRAGRAPYPPGTNGSTRPARQPRATGRRPLLVVYRTLGLGDLLAALPALRALADAFPAHRRVLALPGWLVPLASATGAVDDPVPTRELGPLPPGLERPDVAVNLHGSGPQSHRRLLELRPRRLIAFRHPHVPETDASPRWRDDEHEVVRWCRLLEEAGVPADPGRLGLLPPPGPVDELARDATLVHPGAKTRSRRWPAERFAAVARAEVARGRQVVVTGAPDERGLAEAVAGGAGLPDRAVLAGRTDVAGLARTVAAAGRVVSGDTGVAHLATALGTPSVVIFGPTPPDRWGPPAELRQLHRVVWAGRAGDPLGDEPFDGLLEVSVADVLAELRALDEVRGRLGVGTIADDG